MRAPADIGEQAGGVAHSAVSDSVSGRPTESMKRLGPVHNSSPWRGERERSRLRSSAAEISGSSRCVRGVELLVEQAFAHAEGRDRDLARLPEPDDLLQHDRAVGEQRAARLGDALDVLQRLRVGLLDELEEVEAVVAGRSYSRASHAADSRVAA